MRSNYDAVLKQFMIFCNSKEGQTEQITPDSILVWAENVEADDRIDFLNDFEKWIQGIEVEGYSPRILIRNEKFANPNTAGQKAQGTTRGFFTHNRIWLPKGRKSNGVVPKTKKNDVNYAVFRFDDEAGSVIQDYTQFRYFLSNLSFRDQTIALSLLSTSQDISNLLELNIGFVKQKGKDGKDKERLYWSGNRTKTGEIFKTFFSKEATKYLRQYIAQEREEANPTDPIFLSTRIDEETGTKKPLHQRHVASNFKEVAKKMGIDNGDAQNPFRPKRLRSIFSTACYQAKIDDGARHIFQGHAGSVSERYREIPIANLESIYAQVEPFLTVYAEDRSQEIAKSITKSQQALDMALDLREENKKLRVELGTLTEQVGRFVGFVEMLGYEYDPDTGGVGYDPDRDVRGMTKAEIEKLPKRVISEKER
jgi:hypothetical protein